MKNKTAAKSVSTPLVPAKAPTSGLSRKKPAPFALEQRLIFDADGARPAEHASGDPAQVMGGVGDDLQAREIGPSNEAVPEVPETAVPALPKEIVFIDVSVESWQTLASQVKPGADVFLLDPNKDGFAQIQTALAGRSNISAIHIVSHGSEGALILGSETLTAEAISEHSAILASIGQSLTPDGDVLIYGCDVGAGEAGAALLGRIASHTAADVAASADVTGTSRVGGNWILERNTGSIESSIFLTEEGAAAYDNWLSTLPLDGNTGWTAIMFGVNRDPVGDSQAGAADTDIVGDATHGSLYTAYDTNGTAGTGDDTIAFRIRIDNPTSSTVFGGVAIIGLDANADGKIDLFISIDGRNNTQAVRLLDPGTGANISPSTTSTGPLPVGWLPNNGVYPFAATNYSVAAVAAASDPHWNGATDIGGDGKTDVLVSCRVPLADLATVLAKPSPVDRNGVYGPRGATGIAGFTKDTVIRYVSFTQTQPGPINGDLNGVGPSYDKNATFASLGVFTAPMSSSTPVAAGPRISITTPNGGAVLGDAQDNSIAISGTSEFLGNKTLSLQVSDGNTSVVGMTTTAVDGTWTVSGLDLSGLNDGTLTVTATVANPDGNAGTADDVVSAATLLHDKTPPLITIDQLGVAVAGRPTISGSSDLPDGSLISVTIDPDNDALTANLLYQVVVSGGVWSLNTSTVSPVSGTMPSAGLASQTRITATAVDAAGNSTTVAALDRPTINALSTNSTTPVITGTWSRTAGDILTVAVSGATYTLTPVGNTWSLNLATAIPSSGSLTALVAGNSYDVVAQVARGGDNVTDTTSSEITITATPVITVGINGGASVGGTNTSPTLTGTSSNAGGFVIVRLDPGNDGNLSDAVTYSVTPDGSGNWTLDTSVATPISGQKPTAGFIGAIGVRATDSTGAESAAQLLAISTPSVAIGSITSTATGNTFAAINNAGGGAAWLNVTEDDAVTISGTATNGFTVDLVVTDANGNSVRSSGLVVTGGNWSATGLNFSTLDNSTLTVRATLVGTAISATNTSVTHDATPPRIFITTPTIVPKNQAAISGGSELPSTSLTVTIKDSTNTTTVWTGTATTDTNGNWTVTTPNGVNLVSGNSGTVVITVAPTVQATDTAGNIVQQAIRSNQAVQQGAANVTSTITIDLVTGDNLITVNEISSGISITGTTSLTTALTSAFAVSMTDGTTTVTATVTANVSGVWTATLTKAQVQALKNGPLTVNASVNTTGSPVVTVSDVELPALDLDTPVLTISDDVPGTAAGPVTFTFTFTEAVTGFDATDITVTNGTKGAFSGSGTTYTLVVNPTADSSGTINVSVVSGAANGTNTNRPNASATATQVFNTSVAAAASALTIDTSALATATTPVITGTTSLSAGAPIVVAIDTDNDGVTDLTYSATVQSGGNWTLDTSSATPTSGSLPGAGLNPFAKVTATATNAFGIGATAIGLNKPTVVTQTTNDNTPTITGTWTQVSGDTVSVLVNGVTYSVGNGNLAVTTTGWSLTPVVPLVDNTYSVVATVSRMSGGSAVDPSANEVLVDTLSTVVISGGTAVDITGDSSPTIAGTTSGISAGTVLTLSLDLDNDGSIELIYKTTVAVDGSWSINTAVATPFSGTFPSGGLVGPVKLTATATDGAGNTGTDIQVLTVDLTGPAIALTINSKTADATPVITGTTDLSAGSTITVDIDPNNDGNWADKQTYLTTAQVDGTWSVEATTPISGIVKVRASGIDSVGNSTTTPSKPLEFVLNAPGLTVTTPVVSVGVDNVADSTEDDAVVLAGTTANVTAGSTVNVTVTDGVLTISHTAIVQANGTWSLAALNLSSMANGAISVTATVVDNGDAYTDSTAFDHVKSAVVAIDSISQDTGILADFITKDSTVSISGSATANAGVTVVVRDSGNLIVATFNLTATAGGDWTTADTGVLVPGSYTISATVGGTTVFQNLVIVDAAAPLLSTSTPADNATNVAIASNVTLAFNKNIQAGGGFISLYRGDGTLIENFDVATGFGDAGGTVTFSGTTGVTLNPGADLVNLTGYYLQVDSTAVMDVAGNAFGGIGGSTTLNFTTIPMGVIDVTPPLITGPSGTPGDATSATTINENTTTIATLGSDETVTWSLVGGADQARFAIHTTTGALTFLSAPDFETPTDADTNNTYIVQVQALDGSGNLSTQTITVTVANLDEIAPVITGPSGSPGDAASAVTINENATAVATLGANEAVTWSLVGGADQARFGINASTGALTLLSAPDYETPTDADVNNTYVVQVQALDGSGNLSTQTITVTVANLDEIAPVITGPSGSPGDAASAITINENATAVATLGANEAVTWSLVGGADQARFGINASTGALTFLSAPDYETPTDADVNNTYVVQVQALDGSGNLSTQTITVTVANLDEIAPVITGPSGSPGDATSAITINENATTIATLGANESVTWSLVGGADQARFSINSTTGELTFITAPDYEMPTDVDTNNTYIVQVRALDSSGNNATQTITVTVSDVNEGVLDTTPPAITGPSGGPADTTALATIPENTTEVGEFKADEIVTWSLIGGPDQTHFTIDPSTGRLNFVTSPDFEHPTDSDENNQYVVVVRATDGSGNASSQTVTVTVANVAEGPIAPALEPTSVEIGSTLVPVVVPAFLSGDGAALTYRATQADGTALPAWLSFDPATRTFSGAPPIGTPVIEMVVRIVASAGDLSASVDLIIRVTAPAAPLSHDDLATASEAGGVEDMEPGVDPSGNLLANDSGTGLAITAVQSGATLTAAATRLPNGAGQVSGAYGTLTINADGNFSYAVDNTNPAVVASNNGEALTDRFVYQATDNAGQTSTAVFTVTVQGVTDQIPPIAQPPPSFVPPPAPVTPALAVPLPPTVTSLPIAPVDTLATPNERALQQLIQDFSASREAGAAMVPEIVETPSVRGFQMAVIPGEVPRLVVFRGVPDQYNEAGSVIRFTIPADAFAHEREDSQVIFNATLLDGTPLPSWLVFDRMSGLFSGIVPRGFTGELAIKVIARDANGLQAEVIFRFQVGKSGNAPEAKLGFSAQLRGLAYLNTKFHGLNAARK